MMDPDGEPELDLAHIHWSSPEWIYHLPTHTLSTPDEALDYFALSPFWDIKSNNQSLRVQRQVVDSHYGSAQERLELPAFHSGFEYVVAHTLPPDLFVVHRRDVRNDGSRDNVTGAWFILEGKVYPTPSLYDVMANRLKNASHLISSTFTQLASSHPPSNPRAHSSWRARPAITPSNPTSLPEQAPSAVPPDGDIPPEPTKKKPQAGSGPSGSGSGSGAPNWPLLNALATTRSAIPDLESLSTSPAPKADPIDELREIEEKVLGGGGESSHARPGSTRSISVAKPSRTIDGMSAVGASPAARMVSGLGGGKVGGTPGFVAAWE